MVFEVVIGLLTLTRVHSLAIEVVKTIAFSIFVTKIDEYRSTIDLKDGLRLSPQRHWVDYVQGVELVSRRF